MTPGVSKNFVESDIQLFYIPTNQPQDQSSSNMPANNPSEATEEPVDSETGEGVTDVGLSQGHPRRDPRIDGSTIVGDVTIKLNQGTDHLGEYGDIRMASPKSSELRGTVRTRHGEGVPQIVKGSRHSTDSWVGLPTKRGRLRLGSDLHSAYCAFLIVRLGEV